MGGGGGEEGGGKTHSKNNMKGGCRKGRRHKREAEGDRRGQ